MKKSAVLGWIAGFAVGTATAVAGKITVDKIAKEIKSNLREQSFLSSNGDHLITLSYGSSETAKGLTFIRVTAIADPDEDACKLVIFTKKNAAIVGKWTDNDHFKLLIGNGKRKQCCDVTFGEKQLVANYYLQKDALRSPCVQ